MENKIPYQKISHRCFYFSKSVILFIKTSNYNKIFSSLYVQLLRSATSIGANIVEGAAGSSKKDWRNFNLIALKSANETKYWLHLLKESISDETDKLNELIKEVNEISKIIASIILKANTNKS